jgi:hypothetical protein
VLTGEIIAAVAIVAGIGMVTRRAAHRVTDQAKSEESAQHEHPENEPEHSEGLANPS